MGRRWSYEVVELKASFPGLKSEVQQQTLNQRGLQGWALVNIQNLRLFFKREE